MTRLAAVLTLLLSGGPALAHGGHMTVAAPLHFLAHWGHVAGLVIVIGALIAFYRQRDES